VSLPEAPLKKTVLVQAVEGSRAFRRRIMEMGLVPGTHVRIVAAAPLGDPLTIELRSSRMSLRRAEAAKVLVRG
jgi:ferrous iron transport protein A